MNRGRSMLSSFELPSVARNELGSQSSSIVLPGTILQKQICKTIARPTDIEQPILFLSEPATAVDVFIDTTNIPLAPLRFFIIRVYAVSGDTSVLIARGRVNNSDGSAGLPAGRLRERQKCVATGRRAGTSFIVTFQLDSTAGLPISELPTVDVECPITAIGYQATDSSSLAQPLHVEITSPTLGFFNFHSDCEIIAITGNNAEAAGSPARFIQLWDTTIAAGGPTAVTAVLLEEILVAPQTTFSLAYGDFPLYFAQSFCFAVSSTRTVFTSALAPVNFSYEVR